MPGSIRNWRAWIVDLLRHVLIHRRKSFVVERQYAMAKWLRRHPGTAGALARLAVIVRGSRAKSVAFVCFHTVTPWWDGHLPPGTAGSEEAVVHLARQLAAQGWKVYVYNHCLRRRRIGGVVYVPLWRYNLHEPHAVTVLWRDFSLLASPIASSRTFVWLHNVIEDPTLAMLVRQRDASAIVLSRYHRSTLPGLADRSVFVTRNGIQARRPEASRGSERHPRKCIYTSAPDNGLELLLALWPRIRADVPDAELHLYYGWGTWDFFNGHDPARREWKDRLLRAMEQPGVMTRYEHIDADSLWREYETSSVWLYPTQTRETSCISAIKAQAAGAFPVCTSTGALAETAQWGARIDTDTIYDNAGAQDAFVARAVQLLRHPDEDERLAMMRWAADTFDWTAVANEWTTRFLATLPEA